MVIKKNLYNPRHVLDICAKNEVDLIISLGGVRPQTVKQTDTQKIYGYYDIDEDFRIRAQMSVVGPTHQIHWRLVMFHTLEIWIFLWFIKK